MSSVGSPFTAPDTFGSTPTTAPRLVDLRTGTAWVLGFGAIDANGVPAVIWTVASTWGLAKQRLGATWAAAKGPGGLTWGQAKALVVSP